VQQQLLLDAIADELNVEVGQEDLTERLVMTSRQYGIEPQQLFGYLQENNQLAAMFADVRRQMAIAAVIEKATVTDSDGNTVDTSPFFGSNRHAPHDHDHDHDHDHEDSDEGDASHASHASEASESSDEIAESDDADKAEETAK
jgi:trigger factor